MADSAFALVSSPQSTTTANGALSQMSTNERKEVASVPDTSSMKELSNAEKKKLRQAEKIAKRKQDKDNEDATAAAVASSTKNSTAKATATPKTDAEKQKAIDRHKRSESTSVSRQGQPQSLPVRRRPSQTGPREQMQTGLHTKPKPQKHVPFISHLYNQPRKHTVADAGKDVHPAILTLAQQTAHYVICGSQARTIAMLLTLKSVIATYSTPQGTALSRHLSTQFLSPQLTHLKAQGRPFCTAQSAAIRWLKNYIAALDPNLPEHEAKNRVLSEIDTFIRERFAVADQVIAEEVADKSISDGDTVLTFGKSAVVTRCLFEAVKRGRRFRVIIVDSQPLHEGGALANSLRSLRRGDRARAAQAQSPGHVDVIYVPISSLPHALTTHPPTTTLLGAHTILNNGAVQARCGTALAALLGREAGAKVLVVAESVKFAERVSTDSVGNNELAPEEELTTDGQMDTWHDVDKLYLASFMYDVTPPSLFHAVVTELGTLPPGAAPSVLRMVGSIGDIAL